MLILPKKKLIYLVRNTLKKIKKGEKNIGIFPWHREKKQQEQRPQQQDTFAALDAMTSGLLAGNEARRETGVASRMLELTK